MKVNLEKIKGVEISSGDFIKVKFDGFNEIYSFLYIHNNNGYDEEAYLIDMNSKNNVYISKYFFAVWDKRNDIEILLGMLEHLDFTLVEVIPSDEIEVRRVNK